MLRCNSLSIFMPAPKDPPKRAAWIAKIKAYNAARELSPQAVENMRAGGRTRWELTF